MHSTCCAAGFECRLSFVEHSSSPFAPSILDGHESVYPCSSGQDVLLPRLHANRIYAVLTAPSNVKNDSNEKVSDGVDPPQNGRDPIAEESDSNRGQALENPLGQQEGTKSFWKELPVRPVPPVERQDLDDGDRNCEEKGVGHPGSVQPSISRISMLRFSVGLPTAQPADHRSACQRPTSGSWLGDSRAERAQVSVRFTRWFGGAACSLPTS